MYERMSFLAEHTHMFNIDLSVDRKLNSRVVGALEIVINTFVVPHSSA